MDNDEPLWDRKALAEFIGYSEATIQTMATKQPERLPPRVAGLGRPRWVPSVVRAWVVAKVRELRRSRAGGRARPQSSNSLH